MDIERKRQLKNAYKQKLAIGGVYAIECSGNHRRLIKSTVDIGAIKNRYQLAISLDSCPDPAVRAQWDQYGTDSFSLIVLEEIKMKEGQTAGEFAEDVKQLLELWQMKTDEPE